MHAAGIIAHEYPRAQSHGLGRDRGDARDPRQQYTNGPDRGDGARREERDEREAEGDELRVHNARNGR